MQQFQHSSRLDDLRESIPSSVRSILPNITFVVRHPFNVLNTRTAFAPYLPHPPIDKPDNVYLRIGPPNVLRTYIKAVPQEEPFLQVCTLPPQNFSGFAACAKDLYKRQGLFGFYRGALSTHLVEICHAAIHRRCEAQLEPLADFLETKASQNRCDTDDNGLPPSIPARIHAYWRREIPKLVQTSVAHLLSLTLTYPLSTVCLRQIVYEPADDVRVGFLDMTRLTILHDGSKSLYRGFWYTAFARILATWINGAVNCLAFIKKWPSLEDQSQEVADCLVGWLVNYSRFHRAVSNIPGLPTTAPTLPECFANWVSPATLMDLLLNTGGVALKVATHS